MLSYLMIIISDHTMIWDHGDKKWNHWDINKRYTACEPRSPMSNSWTPGVSQLLGILWVAILTTTSEVDRHDNFPIKHGQRNGELFHKKMVYPLIGQRLSFSTVMWPFTRGYINNDMFLCLFLYFMSWFMSCRFAAYPTYPTAWDGNLSSPWWI